MVHAVSCTLYAERIFRMSNKEGLTNVMSKFATAYGQSASRPRLDFNLSVVCL